jgi:seryl-tRNA synthetase
MSWERRIFIRSPVDNTAALRRERDDLRSEVDRLRRYNDALASRLNEEIGRLGRQLDEEKAKRRQCEREREECRGRCQNRPVHGVREREIEIRMRNSIGSG